MQYEAETPEAYLDALENDWRKEKLQEVRQMLMKEAHGLTEGIEYKMLCYSDDSQDIFHLNAQKDYVSLYLGDIKKVADSEKMLEGFSMGKGCIRIKKSVQLSATRLNDFIDAVVAFRKAGGDTDC